MSPIFLAVTGKYPSALQGRVPWAFLQAQSHHLHIRPTLFHPRLRRQGWGVRMTMMWWSPSTSKKSMVILFAHGDRGAIVAQWLGNLRVTRY
jgi:hypothetical protein